jgi:hypothetical protein
MSDSPNNPLLDEDGSIRLGRRVPRNNPNINTLAPVAEDLYADNQHSPMFDANIADSSASEDEDMSVRPTRQLGLGVNRRTFVPAAAKQLERPSTPKNTVSSALENKNATLAPLRMRASTV